ncbi:hypothetical protein SEPCBS119000_002719 [Sporothrix epigloea]|uniref:FHA domain-containing protein n=1 Tax=Sporothrix epigloea TaxID=1892477 RepID=A0ABP0DL65_9PEZI
MWLLENAGQALGGQRLWLRPGQRYLFGRTPAEPGQLIISDKTISRKHLTIEVGPVREGDGTNVDARSVVTIKDLATKIGTVINGTTQIRGQQHVLSGDRTTIKMGHLADLFTISWHPVILSFSFSSRELRSTAPDDPQNPWMRLRRDLEPLDIHFLAEFRRGCTTHVVSKKRNTSRTLQALINGSYIVSDTFLDAIVAAAASGRLEKDFDAAWPNALDHLPPRGDEPSDRPSSTYAPDAQRANLFDGYTFCFYDEKQYDNLLPPIADGRGKARLPRGADAVVPGQTEVDDFVRYVKAAAGEQGLGEFEDGSTGRGVVVVRYVPAKGDHVAWFTRFTTAVALRLDHRLVDQREFLDAVLAVEPSMLRRPLEVEDATAVAAAGPPISDGVMDLDDNGTGNNDAATADEPKRPSPTGVNLSQASSVRRARARRGVTTSRFKGFDADLASDVDDGDAVYDIKPSQGDGDMFVSQQDPCTSLAVDQPTRRTKRTAAGAESVEEEDNVMDDIAPTAAAVKRRRIEAGVAPVPPKVDASDDEMDPESQDSADGAKPAAIKQEPTKDDILEQARRNREAAEKRLAEERQRLAELPDDGLDAAAIRRLTIVETMEVRIPESGGRQRGRPLAAAANNTRWKPEWNGRRNFKQFRKQGDVVGRPPQRVIVALEPAKTKEYGIGDGYWLEGGDDRHAAHHNSPWDASSRQALENGRLHEKAKEAPARLDRAASRRGGSVDSAPVVCEDAEIISDSDPDDTDHGGGRGRGEAASTVTSTVLAAAATARHSSNVQRQGSPASVRSSHTITTATLPTDLPRTRAAKAAIRTASARSSQASQSRAAPTPSAGTAAGDPSSMTSSSLLVFDTLPPSTQESGASDATAEPRAPGRGAKRLPAAAPSAAAPLAKRPRRGANSASSSVTAAPSSAAAVVIHDSDDEDDGLHFKFRSRR